MATMTRRSESNAPQALLLAFELGERTWKIGFRVGADQRVRVRQLPAGAVAVLMTEIAAAKKRFGLAVEATVVSCYEAGRDGFWLHRYLVAHDIRNHVVDSSSIEVNRRARRAKTDWLDLGGLLSLWARYVQGDRRVWRVVRVPTVTEEDAHQLPRTAESLTRDRTRLVNRVKALLATQGVRLAVDHHFVTALNEARLWDATPIPAGLRDRILRDWTPLQTVDAQLRAVKLARAARVDTSQPTGRAIAQLPTLRAIGPTGAWVLATEIFGWRQIQTGRQLGALVGLVPAPYQSGEMRYDQGISRAGNRHVRRVMVPLAWGWVRYQPASALSRWYHHRFGSGGPRLRKIGGVALARKLLIRPVEVSGDRRGACRCDAETGAVVAAGA
jgi:transposase